MQDLRFLSTLNLPSKHFPLKYPSQATAFQKNSFCYRISISEGSFESQFAIYIYFFIIIIFPIEHLSFLITSSCGFNNVRKNFLIKLHQLYKYVTILTFLSLHNRKPTATILPTIEVPRYRPAPVVAYFSSRGPSQLAESILKVINFFHFRFLISIYIFRYIS